MNQTQDKYKLWGTFSVMDHIKEGAFLAEVIMYDRLVIPVPPDPKNAETEEDRQFAQNQWKRWKRHGWAPQRQRKLLNILKPVAIPIEWTRNRHQQWANEYERSRRDATQQVSQILAGWKTGEQLLSVVPAMAGGIVAVSPYDSLAALKQELGITETSTQEEQLRAGRGLPGNLVSTVVGREFLVPEDPDRDEYYLLRKAVKMVQNPEYKQARSDFHNAQQRFINNEKTDFVSIKTAVEEMAHHLNSLEQITRRQRIWNGIRRAFYFTEIVFDLIGAPVNPVAAGKAAISLGKFTLDERSKDINTRHGSHVGGALLLDAHRRLKLTLEPEKDS
jgi:hypothetical protein